MTAWRLVESTARLVWQNLWALAIVYMLCDSAIFLLHRTSHRMTNEGAQALLKACCQDLYNRAEKAALLPRVLTSMVAARSGCAVPGHLQGGVGQPVVAEQQPRDSQLQDRSVCSCLCSLSAAQVTAFTALVVAYGALNVCKQTLRFLSKQARAQA